MSELDERRVEGVPNQSAFREVNERIEKDSDTLAVPELSVLCECHTACAELVLLTEDEYQEIRRIPTHFVVKPEHVAPDIERVVETHERYAVVETFGEGGKLAVRLDPRRRPLTEPDTIDPPY
jgi:hypothetical protein